MSLEHQLISECFIISIKKIQLVHGTNGLTFILGTLSK